jgi:hypothetical protein
VIQQLELLNLERDAEIAESRRLQENISAKHLQEKGVICILNLVVQGIRICLYGRTIISFGCNPSGGCWLKTGNLPVKKTGKWNFTGIIY